MADNKAIADVMANPLLTMFSRYHYGVLKGYGQIIKNLSDAGFKGEGFNAKGEPVNRAGRTEDQEKARALSIAAGLAIMLAIVYPALDQLAEKATGNKDARVRRAGYSNFADALNRAIHGDITPLQAARSMVTPAVLGETAVDLAANRDVFGTGRKIYNEHGTGREIAEQVGTKLAESVSPAQLAMRASESHESFKKTLLSLVGISFPRHGALRLAAKLNADRFGDEPRAIPNRNMSAKDNREAIGPRSGFL